MIRTCTATAGVLLLVGSSALGRQDGTVDAPQVVRLTRALTLEPLGRRGRTAVAPDPVRALLASGAWATPRADDVVVAGDREAAWTAAEADEQGRFSGPALRGGYVLIMHGEPAERIMLLHAVGHSTAWVNGEPRGGDPYSTGFIRVPVRLRAGENELLFSTARGQLRAALEEPTSPGLLDVRDGTVPDLVVDEPVDTVAGFVVINATVAPMTRLRVDAVLGGLGRRSTSLPVIPPLSLRKVMVHVAGAAPSEAGPVPLRLELVDERAPTEHVVLDEADLDLAVVSTDALVRRTFVSEIDGTVQYYAVRPAAPGDGAKPGLVLTLHGAGVEGRGQAARYAPRGWAHVVAPTNRRPFGFDWEDWGRLDALEVLALAGERLGTDPRRTWLTGHSMGGHGTWNLGVHFPDRFAAIAPSAGWISFWSYTGAEAYEDAEPIERILRRAAAASDTLALSRNYLHQGVYVLHGSADDNVPVEQARTMREHLGTYHADFAYYERPGAGHWWGNACVDWPPLMDFLSQRVIPEPRDVQRLEFATVSPGISARCHWLTVVAQQRSMETSRVTVELDPGQRRFTGTTENVGRLAIDLAPLAATDGERAAVLVPGEPVVVALDAEEVTVPWPVATSAVHLRREGGSWIETGPPSPAEKTADRCGPFKDAMRHRFMLVYGTGGTEAERRWAFAKARYDAETFYYRGNGSVEVIADVDFDAAATADRGVVLYGNADTNGAWGALLSGSPVQVRRGAVTIGERRMEGDDLGVLLVRPRPDGDVACVAVVGGTGEHGMRLTDGLPYFVSGVGYPDVMVLGPEALETGTDGIRAAGFFGPDWSIETGEMVMR